MYDNKKGAGALIIIYSTDNIDNKDGRVSVVGISFEGNHLIRKSKHYPKIM